MQPSCNIDMDALLEDEGPRELMEKVKSMKNESRINLYFVSLGICTAFYKDLKRFNLLDETREIDSDARAILDSIEDMLTYNQDVI